MMEAFREVPQDLKDHNQWVCWKWQGRDGKRTKPPYDPGTGKRASHSDPGTWGTYQQAIDNLGRFDGIGYVFTETDPFCGIDIDNCLDPTSGQVAPWADRLVKEFNSYTEISPSGTGLKIFTRGTLPNGGLKTKHVEVYDRLRYFTVTGRKHGSQTEVREAQDALNNLVEKIERRREKPKPTPEGSTTFDDNRLIDGMLGSSNGDKVLQLLNGDITGYPSQSEADQALCNHLAFWTGNDPAQMDRIFRTSGLYREKWNKKHYGDGRTYGQATIEKAITGGTEKHGEGRKQSKGPKGLGLDQLKTQYDSEVSWVWRQHFPFGLPVIVNGREGMGKTTICLRAARETLRQHPGGMIVWLATEGAVQDTVAKMVEQKLNDPRFVVAQRADESFKWDFIRQGDRKELETLLDELRPILIVFIDSIRGMSRLDDNDPKNGDVIHAINSIVCDKHKAGLVYIDHHGKGHKDNLLDRAVGTTAKTSSVRGVLSVLPVSKFKRVIRPAKANISSMGGELEVLKVGNDIIIQEPVAPSDESLKGRAEEFLIKLFNEQKTMAAAEVYRIGESQGFSGSLLKTVKKDLGIQSHRDGEKSAWKWVWPYIS